MMQPTQKDDACDDAERERRRKAVNQSLRELAKVFEDKGFIVSVGEQ